MKNNRPIAKAKSLSRETQTDGRIQISDTHLAEVQGVVSSKGYLDQSFFVPLTYGNQRVVEKTVRLTPIPRKIRTIRNRDLDFPTEIALSGEGNFAYVINSQLSTVSRISVDADEVLSTLAISANSRIPKDIIVHPITGDILVANSFVKPIKLGVTQNDTVSIVSESFNRSIQVNVGNYPIGLGINPTTNQLYVANQSSKTISIIDLGKRKEIGLLVPFQRDVPGRMVLVDNNLYVIVGESVEVFDTRLKKHLKIIRNVFGPMDVEVSSNQKFVYAVNNKKNSLGVINTMSRSVIQEIPVGPSPARVAVSKGLHQHRDLIYVVNQGDSTITMIESRETDEGWQAQVASEPIKVGFMPFGICATQDKVYSVIRGNSAVDVLEF